MQFNTYYVCAQIRYEDEDEDEGPQPDPTLEQGLPIPVRLQGGFPPELASTPLEDIDPFYNNQTVHKALSRFPLYNVAVLIFFCIFLDFCSCK